MTEVAKRSLDASNLHAGVYGYMYYYAMQHEENAILEDAEGLAYALASAIKSARYFTPEVKPSEVLKNCCLVLGIDHALLEVVLGVRLDKLDKIAQ